MRSRTTRSRFVAAMAGLALFAVLWFGAAGRLTWWPGWGVLVAFVVYVGAMFARLSAVNPDLLRERVQSAEKAEPWDRVVIAAYNAALLILLIVAALDSGRYGASAVPVWTRLTGWLLVVVAGLMVWHVMMTNAYLSSWARLQNDRGQVVVQDGAYRRIRHPMYLGIIFAFLGLPLALGSWWAMIPGVVIVGLFV